MVFRTLGYLKSPNLAIFPPLSDLCITQYLCIPAQFVFSFSQHIPHCVLCPACTPPALALVFNVFDAQSASSLLLRTYMNASPFHPTLSLHLLVMMNPPRLVLWPPRFVSSEAHTRPLPAVVSSTCFVRTRYHAAASKHASYRLMQKPCSELSRPVPDAALSLPRIAPFLSCKPGHVACCIKSNPILCLVRVITVPKSFLSSFAARNRTSTRSAEALMQWWSWRFPRRRKRRLPSFDNIHSEPGRYYTRKLPTLCTDRNMSDIHSSARSYSQNLLPILRILPSAALLIYIEVYECVFPRSSPLNRVSFQGRLLSNTR